MTVFFGALLVFGVLSGLLLAFKFRNPDPLESIESVESVESIDRLIIAVLPPLGVLIAFALVLIVKAQSLDLWSDVRLARTFAIYHGYKLYPSADTTGPILGALHMPVSHLLFAPAILAPSPTSAIYVACLISIALILFPLAWLFCFPNFARPRNLHLALFALTTSGLLILIGGSGGAPRFMMVHTDAAAVGFAALAAGLLCSTRAPLSWRRLLLAALCATLSIGAKQTMLPLVVALCLFLFIADGLRTTLRYLLCLIGTGLAFAAFCLAVFHPIRDFLFNTVILATHRHPRGAGLSTFEGIFRDSLYTVLPCALAITAFVILWLFRNGSARGIRGLFDEHRWLVFPIVGLLLAPASMKARMTIGGAENHTAIFSFFFFVGIGLALLRFMIDDSPQGRTQEGDQASPARGPSHSLAAKMLTGLIIAFCIPGTFEKIRSTHISLHNQPDYEAALERYTSHPTETTYFADAPLATFYHEHRFYDVDTMLLDREDAGRPITAAQFAAAIPTDAQRVVVPDGLRRSQVLQDYTAGWTAGTDPDLPGMVVYERPKPTTVPAPAQ